ncbi:MAG: alkaline phosphatase [Cyanobacteria bacterium J06623_7]
MGGGEIHYLPVGTVGRFGEEGIREDGRNLIVEAEEFGYTVVYTREELEALPADTEKVLGIFAAEDTYNDTDEADLVESGFVDDEGNLILYGQPGNENPPTVAEMLETTLALDKFTHAEDGFMVVLEEEGSDNFPNNNNGAGGIEATLRADDAIGVAQDFVNNVDPNTLVLTAADSDAGGLEIIDVDEKSETVGTIGVQSEFTSFGDNADRIQYPLDGTTGNDTAPFTTGDIDADGDIFNFGVAYVSRTDVAGGIVSKAYGLNSDLLEDTVDNTDMYRIMYQTLFGVAPEAAASADSDNEVNVISGAGGRDTLTAAEGADLFVLGNEDGAFYSSASYDDSAEISHFVPGEDVIQLAGSLEDYSILVNEGRSVAIALDNDGDGAFDLAFDLAFDEFIASVGDGFEISDLVFVSFYFVAILTNHLKISAIALA